MNIQVQVSTRDAELYLDGVHKRHIPFAASKALNDTAKHAQAGVRRNLASEFILRRPDFILREGAKIPKFSTKERLEVELRVGDQAPFLTKFERGTPKVPTRSRNLALPAAAARPTVRTIVPEHLRPRNLGLRRHSLNLNLRKGRHRTFLIPGAGIFQRTGPGRDAIRLLWGFTPRPARTPATLNFERTVRETIQTAWQELFGRAFAMAIRTAK